MRRFILTFLAVFSSAEKYTNWYLYLNATVKFNASKRSERVEKEDFIWKYYDSVWNEKYGRKNNSFFFFFFYNNNKYTIYTT